jgi:hypothetical protein
MSDAEKAYQATPASTLEEEIMNPCIAKNEREWWAAAEIERLRALLKEVDDWVRDLEPFAGADHEPVTVFKKVRAALAQEKSNG